RGGGVRRRAAVPPPSTTRRTRSPRPPAGSVRRWSASPSTTSLSRTGWPSAAGDDLRVSNLGPDWQRLPDGTAYRRAARVVVFDAEGRVLLARGHDADQLDRTWWFTIGGGIEPGETPRAAAARALAEESGLQL